MNILSYNIYRRGDDSLEDYDENDEFVLMKTTENRFLIINLVNDNSDIDKRII